MKTRGSHTPFPTEAPENGRGQSLTVPALRTTVLLAVMFALQVLCRAQSIEFTSDCVSEADRELLTDVHEFLFDHRSEIWEEIARNPDGLYADVDDKFRDRWMEEIEHVKIKCGYDSINVCGNHPDRGGRCGFWADNDFNPFGDEFSDKILICLDNLSDYSQSTGVPLFALLCETMAHEVMHQGDGWGLGFNHEIAYTVGEAAQCVAVSPDLDPEIVSVTTAPDSASTNLDVEITVHVRDENPYSSAEALTTLVKGGEYVNSNGYSTLELYVDGDRVGAKSIPGVDPSGPGTYIFTIELDPSYSDGSFEIKVLADKDEDLGTRRE